MDHSSSSSQSEGFLQLIRECNGYIFSGSSSNYRKFFIEGKHVGLIRSDFLEPLKKFPDTFIFKNSPDAPDCQEVHLCDSLVDVDQRTNRMASILEKLRAENAFTTLRGWRDERYDVMQKFTDPPLLRLERASTCIFGSLQYGVHVNAYTYGEDGQLMMWIGRRAPDKATWPGKLDNMCAGGLGTGLDVYTCAVKECQEEASVALEHLEKLKPVGSVSYIYEDERGLFPETQFVFDLCLPSDFQPVNADGEVAGFQLVSIDEVKQMIVSQGFKPNCALIILHFLIRWGIVTPQNEPNYLFLVDHMHYPLQSFYDAVRK